MSAAVRVIEGILGMSVADAALSLTAQRCEDGLIILTDPTCTRDDIATLSLDQLCLPSMTNISAAFEENVRSCWSGTEATSALDIFIDTVSGDTAEDSFSIDGTPAEEGDNVVNDNLMAASGTLRFRGVGATLTVQSSGINWDIVGVPEGDLSPPTTVQGCIITTDVGLIEYTCPPAIDTGGAGMSYVEVYDDAMLVETINVASGLQLDHSSLVEFGTTGSPMYTPGDLEFEIEDCAGEGLPVTGNQGFCAGTPQAVSGVFWAQSCTATGSVTTTSDFSLTGWMFRATSNPADQTERYIAAWKQVDEALTNVRNLFRWVVQDGGSAASSNPGLGDYDCVALQRISNGDFRGHAKDFTDEQWLPQMTDNALALPDTLFAAPMWHAATSADSGALVSSTMTQAGVTNAPWFSGSYETMAAADLTFVACDADDNCAPASVTYSATPGAPPMAGAKNWNPGFQLQEPHVGWLANSGQWSDVQSRIAEVCSTTNVVGYHIRFPWGNFEPTTQGGYTFTRIDQMLAMLAACDKQLILQLQAASFGGGGICSQAAPLYVRTESQYDGGAMVANSGNACYALVWKQAVMDRFIAAKSAIANRYDGDPNFEGFVITETAISPMPAAAGYSPSAHITQLKRAIDSAASEFEQTQIIVFFNYLTGSNPTQQIDFFQHILNAGAIHSGPDTRPQVLVDCLYQSGPPCAHDSPRTRNPITSRTQGERVLIGETGGVDYRGLIGRMCSIQVSSLGTGSNNGGNYMPEELLDECNTLASHYQSLMYKNYQTGGEPDEGNWNMGGMLDPRGTKDWVEEGDWIVTNTDCPPNVTAGCL
jgi:hypothetical protein